MKIKIKKSKISPVKRINLTHQVINLVKEYIINENLKPGDKLPSERELCDIIKVSRNIIREAMRSLESAGIIYKLQGKGIYISSFNEKIFSDQLSFRIDAERIHINEVLKVREAFEMAILELLTEKVTDDQVATLYRFLDDFKLKDFSSFKQFTEEDIKFHKLILSFLNNPLIERLGFVFNEFFKFCYEFDKNLNEDNFKKKKKFYLDDFVKKHSNISNAISMKDLDKCREVVIEHMSGYQIYLCL